MLVDSIRRQTTQIFENIEILLNAFNEDEFSRTLGGFLIWKQFYHLVHSLDKNFVDPSVFHEPSFHIDNLDIIYFNSEISLSKSEILDYYSKVQQHNREYLDRLTDEMLLETIDFRDMKLTKLELILAQLRHVFYHVGYLHCIKKIQSGVTPDYVGLYKAVEKIVI